MEMLLKESKVVVLLNTWVLISNLKVAYNLIRRPDGTFNRYVAEYLDRKVKASITPKDGMGRKGLVHIDIPTTCHLIELHFVKTFSFNVSIQLLTHATGSYVQLE